MKLGVALGTNEITLGLKSFDGALKLELGSYSF